MIRIGYKPQFLRQYKKLSSDLQNDVKRCIDALQQDPEHPFLKTHKLKGKLSPFWSCSVNFSYRIVFERTENEIILLMVGDHDVYK